MADDDRASQTRPPVNVYTAMLVLSFLAIAVGCMFLSFEMFVRQLPLAPSP